MKEKTAEERPIIIDETTFSRLVESVGKFCQEFPELAEEFERRKSFWEAANAHIDNLVSKQKLTVKEAYSIRAGITATKEVLAARDSLTGLFNRREWEKRFTEVHADSQRSNRPLTAILADVNELKRINDGKNHLAGDQALKKVAEAIQESIRKEDVPGRVGGDEFRVLCVNCELGGAQEIAQRIQSALVGEVTVSIGVGQIRDQETPVEFINRIDKAMYQAKTKKEIGVSQIVVSHLKQNQHV